MTYKVYGFVIDCGDGSSIIKFFDKMPDEQKLELSPHMESYFDGDGLTHKQTLTFENKSQAISCGIRIQNWDDEYT